METTYYNSRGLRFCYKQRQCSQHRKLGRRLRNKIPSFYWKVYSDDCAWKTCSNEILQNLSNFATVKGVSLQDLWKLRRKIRSSLSVTRGLYREKELQRLFAFFGLLTSCDLFRIRNLPVYYNWKLEKQYCWYFRKHRRDFVHTFLYWHCNHYLGFLVHRRVILFSCVFGCS